MNLPHRFAGRLAGRQALLAHDALDVLHYHDGVIHQQADRQHHREHRQGVDAVATGIQHRKGAHQHHRHGDGRDQGGAEVLQEQIHHEEDQQDRLQQRFDHISDGGLYEGGRLVGDFIFQTVRKILRQLIEAIDHSLRRGHFVGAGSKLNSQARSGLPVVAAEVVVLLRPHLDGGDIAQRHL